MRIAAICGSLRRGSFNQALLDTAVERAPEGLEISQVDISGFPFFSQDLERESYPASVTVAKQEIQASACLLLVTPEYDYGVPGILKNSVEWLSRPPGDPTIRNLPMALMGASSGYMGTIRAQLAWRQMWHYFHAPVFSSVEMTVAFAAKAVENGRVVEEGYLRQLDMYLAGLEGWLRSPACAQVREYARDAVFAGR